MSPTQRTMALLRELGFSARIVEHWNPFARRRQDLWGADIIAMREGVGILLIQTTTGDNHAARREKLAGIPEAWEWMRSGGRFEIWSWSKTGGRGKRKLWTLRREELEP
jgi:hypothetical protein